VEGEPAVLLQVQPLRRWVDEGVQAAVDDADADRVDARWGVATNGGQQGLTVIATNGGQVASGCPPSPSGRAMKEI